MSTSSAKSGHSTKKKTAVSSTAKHEAQSADGSGLGSILGAVEQLAMGGESGGSNNQHESPLTAILSSLVGGGGNSSENGVTSPINYASIIEMLLPMLMGNAKHSESFKSNPGDTIKQLTGVHVGEQHLGPIVEGLLSQLNSK